MGPWASFEALENEGLDRLQGLGGWSLILVDSVDSPGMDCWGDFCAWCPCVLGEERLLGREVGVENGSKKLEGDIDLGWGW